MDFQKRNRQDIIAAFAALELPEDQVLFYLLILENGQVLEKTVRDSASIIDNLKSLGLLYCEADQHGKDYICAIDPKVAVNSLYSQRLWQYMPDENWSNSGAHFEICKRYFEAKSYLVNELGSRYSFNRQNLGNIINIHESLSSSALSISIRQAAKEIMGMTIPPWLPNTALVWEAIKDRIRNGVKYKRLCDEVTIIAFGHRTNVRDVSRIGVDLRVLPRENFKEKFFTIDDNEAFVFYPADLHEGFKLEATQIILPPFVRIYKEKYINLWKQGVSGKEIIGYVESLRDNFINRCIEGYTCTERQVIEGIFDYGKFFKLHYTTIDDKRLFAFLKNLELKGLLIPCPDAGLRYLPNILSEIKEYIVSKQLLAA